MTDTADATPTSLRRVESAEASRLAGLVEAYDDIQTALRCFERLVTLLGGDAGGGVSPAAAAMKDEVGIESIWTLALLCYARAFAEKEGGAVLTEDDLVEPAGMESKGDGADGEREVVRWHRVLMHLRDHHTNPVVNPREVYTVGVAQGENDEVTAVAVTSVREPLVDLTAVRQAGAIAFPLGGVLDERIGSAQKEILETVRTLSKEELGALEVIEVAPQ